MWVLLLLPLARADEVSTKIINGEVGTLDDFPQAGALLAETGGAINLQCSSSLIAPDVVITAAHCVDPSVVGATSFDNVGWSRESDLTAFQSASEWPEDATLGTEWVFHDEWDLASLGTGLALNYDIGLLFLETALTDIPLAYLPTADEATQIQEGATVSIVGWGMDNAADSASYGIKHYGDSTIDALADYEFQVGAATEAVRKCHGDSGGPSFLDVDTPSSVKARMIGITSHTWDETDCAETGGVDTRADYYLDWVDEEMRARCEDGSRVWCGFPGILPPPVHMTDAELLADLKLVGCSSSALRWSGGWLAGLLLLATRRRPAPGA